MTTHWTRLSAAAALALVALGALGCRRDGGSDTPPPPPRGGARTGDGSGQRPLPGVGAGGEDTGLLLGNPSAAGKSARNNLLLERPEHALSYNAELGGPNWVAWHLDEGDLGRAERSSFRPDPLLPEELQVRPGDYTGSGFDRGHVCPSGDRTRTKKANQATFVMSNILPQAAALNQQVWKRLEDHCRGLAQSGQEMYIVAGGAGSSGRIGRGKVNVPAACWKVIVALPRGSGDRARVDRNTRVIAVMMPNRESSEVARAPWSRYLVSPAQIERATGLRFFSELPAPVRAALLAKVDAGRDDRERS